ncbi:MAG: DUF1735 domain-containing protein [Bacteroidales bacterium]|nr:DUF1735 domain-containing protein [Bacteroides sp.]MCM1197373.1 DUF1735 domain-containing protein [Clostridium sp.]MCM1501607.1 DUF1735 domain-containing protein [Bacteroidales bacterium]
MKKHIEITAISAMALLSLASCEEMVDYQTTIDAAPKLAYVNPKGGDTFSTLIVHRPTGSTGSFSTEFQVNCNTTDHSAVNVNVGYDADLVAEYNQKNGTAYSILPEEFILMENPNVVIAADTTASRDTVRIMLNQEADLSKLTERSYLAPFRLVADGLKASEQMGNLWFIVNTEVNLIRPLESASDMIGFAAGGTSEWTADCADYKNLFDGSNSTGTGFSTDNRNVLTIDMKKSIMVTGLKVNGYTIDNVSIEYSEDGSEWSQAGTPVSGEFISTGSSWSAGDWYAAVYDYFTARYLRLSFDMSGYYNTINEISVYMIESTEPTIYTETGADNVVTGKVVHKKGVGSTSDFSASFKAFTTISSDKGYTVTAKVDNSLISAFNSKHGTAYKALPSGNLDLQANASIAPGANSSSENISISLAGDLSQLNDEDGYLVPLKLEAAGAVVSESRGTVYAVIKSETNLIRAISSVDEIVGFPAGGRSSWSADVEGAEQLFDGNNSTRVNFQNSGNVMTVNLGGKHLVTGLGFNCYSMNNLSIEYSLDGTSWKSAGTVADNERVFTGSSWSAGDWYMAFADYIEAAYLRLSFGFSGYYASMGEMNIYEIESTEPTIYTVCGNDNVLNGKITHHVIAGSSASLSASFNAMTTVSSADGYAVGAEVDNSLVAAFNSRNRTSYASLDASYIEISGVPCQIAGGANKSAGTISVALKGDLSKLTNTNGYLIPVKLTAPGAVTSEGRGVVYVAVAVEKSDAVMQSGFSIESIAGTQVADRSGWTIVDCDEGGIHSGSYPELFDGNTTTYIRTWGGPVQFTVDLGKEYEMTGLVITARTDNNSYAGYQPTSISVRGSVDGDEYTDFGTAASSEGTLVASKPSSYVSFYGSKTVRYLKIEAGYGSNMGTSEFNIYAK